MGKKIRILHIDDDPLYLGIVRAIFNSGGFVVKSVNSGGLGIGEVFRNTFDIVIIDIDMPEMNGKVAAKTIKSMVNNMPIIALTSSNIEELIELPQFDFILSKPVQKEKLRKTVIKFVEKSSE